MKLPKIAINNAQFVIIMVLIAVVVGMQTLDRMPRSEDPQVNFPFYVVTAIYPGTSPEDMENLIVDPIEKVLDEIDNVKEINSVIGEGRAVISIEGESSRLAEEQFDEVVREVNSVRSELPEDIAFFDVRKPSPTASTSIKIYALTSETVSYGRLLNYAERLEDQFKKLNYLYKVDIEAYPKEEVRISLDFQRMASQHILLPQVLNTLSQNNINLPGGSVKAANRSFSIKTTGGYKNLEELKNTVIATANDNIVYLKDIATVAMDYEDPQWIGRYNRENAIFISLKIKEGKNILNTTEDIQAIEQQFKKQLPPNMALYTAFEQAPAVEARINDFFANLLQGVVLVGLIILLFLGWRPALVIMLIIPLCILIALSLLFGLGFGLQQISIASLVLALGLLVDNGIVVVENINNFVEEGEDLKTAAAKGTGEVGYAIISSTITTLLSFFPLSQLGGGPGEFLKSLPVTVILTLLVSLVLALTLSPILASQLLKIRKKKRPSFVSRILKGITHKIYRPILKFSLKRGWLILLAAIGLTAFSISLFPSIGVSFFPTADKPLLLIDIETPGGTNIETTDKVVRFVESVLDTMPYVKDYCGNAGNSNSQVYYNRTARRGIPNYGQVMVNFKEWNPRKFQRTIYQLRKDFAHYPGAKITLSELKNGAPITAPIDILIFGENLDTLKRLAGRVENLLKNTEGVINVENPLSVDKTELNIALNREKAGLLNLSYLGFDQTIRASLTGLQFTKVSFDDGEDYPMVVRMPFDEQPSIADFNKVYFNTQADGQVPLRQVADIHFQSANNEIRHKDLNRFTSLLASTVDADQTVPITVGLIDTLNKMNFPEGYYFETGGEYADQQSTFGDLGIILILAQVAIFAVLVLQFRSILQPIAVFAAIPLAISGSFIALFLTGWPFSFFAFVGFISLIGIVVNSSIIMVDYINQLRARGLSRLEAIQQGSERRFVPVALTTITTILGLLPLTVQASNLWSPLGWTIIGGMISSTLMTLLVVPVLYKWFTWE